MVFECELSRAWPLARKMLSVHPTTREREASHSRLTFRFRASCTVSAEKAASRSSFAFNDCVLLIFSYCPIFSNVVSLQEVPDDADLSFYDKKRLEAEYRKLKELKHKAEQYAVEAKQTAQRLSAENFKLKEDLSREQHFNELERKNILRDMEAKMGQRRGEEEMEEAKKEVMQQTIHERAQDLATTMKASNLGSLEFNGKGGKKVRRKERWKERKK